MCRLLGNRPYWSIYKLTQVRPESDSTAIRGLNGLGKGNGTKSVFAEQRLLRYETRPAPTVKRKKPPGSS